jgi:deoxycytidine triphosphate deaminase
MILSDRTIRDALAAGHIEIEPLDESDIQPSSVDLHIDRYFRVFRNHTMRVIDVKEDQEELTELVEASDEDPFILHPGEFVLGSTRERVRLPDDLVARLEGKALGVETEVPTPGGWRTMGELRPGDLVFHSSGRPTRVVAVSNVMAHRPCYEVEFSDGRTITADADHQWMTWAGRGGPQVRTTRRIAASMTGALDGQHRVAVGGPVAYPAVALRGDPYLVGRLMASAARSGSSVPDGCLTAPIPHRLTLLQGLMDAGGDVDATGRCWFSSGDEHLADAVAELAAGLGLIPAKLKDPGFRDGIELGPCYRVHFTTDLPVFRGIENRARLKAGAHRRFRRIVGVRRCETVPVRCIEVAASDGMFLVTRSFIPTHNSSLGRLGLLIHSTAGFVDAGWNGQLTLELSNVANLPITLYPGMKIGQISFLQMTTPAEHPYGSREVGSKYQHQVGPRPSRYFENFRR